MSSGVDQATLRNLCSADIETMMAVLLAGVHVFILGKL